MDSIESRAIFRRARFWSLDGAFLDDVDPEWIFWQRESELKNRLYGDYFGKAIHSTSTSGDGNPEYLGRPGPRELICHFALRKAAPRSDLRILRS